MSTRILLAAAVLLCAAPIAEAQAVRFDSISSTTSSSCTAGKQCPLMVLPGTRVSVCQGAPSTLAGCLSSPATTYTSASAGTPCSTTSQLTPATGGACLATADNQGNLGAWFLPGSYGYYLRIPDTAGGGTYGPYPINLGASAGCPLGATCDANYATLALAYAAAGTGTLYVTRAWNAQATASYTAAATTFLGNNARIQPASGQTVTLGPNIQCDPNQQCFDLSASGSIAFSSLPTRIYGDWWGAKSNGSTDSAAAVTACINAAHAFGGTCGFNAGSGSYVLASTVALPVAASGVGFVTIDGGGNPGPQQGTGTATSTRFICPASLDCFSASFADAASNTYTFNNLQLIGSGVTSGNGIKICCKSVAGSTFNSSNLSFANFMGTNKWALYLDGSEDGLISNTSVASASNGFLFTNAANANSLINPSILGIASTGDAMLVQASSGISMFGGLFQANSGNGLRFHGSTNDVVYGTWFESNNGSATSGKGAMIFDSTGTKFNLQIDVRGTRFGNTNDKIIAVGDGTAVSSLVSMSTMITSGVSSPRITLGASATSWTIRDSLSDCTQITDGGVQNIISNGNIASNCNSGYSQIFNGFLGVNTGTTAPLAPYDVYALTAAPAYRVTASGDATSMGFMRLRFDGGGAGMTLGSNFHGGGDVVLLDSDAAHPWLKAGGTLQLSTATFAGLSSLTGNQLNNGNMILVSDGSKTNPCTGGGTGAIAKRLNGAWVCD